MYLPKLTATPTTHQHSCLSLSTVLLSTISIHLPPSPQLTLSIGSGNGLLEALLIRSQPIDRPLNLQAVEASHSVNRYLPDESLHVVSGTWALSPLAGKAKAWLFVYPRDPALVSRYVDEFGREKAADAVDAAAAAAVEVMLWLGPRVDWDQFEVCFDKQWLVVEEVKDSGLASYEMMMVIKKVS